MLRSKVVRESVGTIAGTGEQEISRASQSCHRHFRREYEEERDCDRHSRRMRKVPYGARVSAHAAPGSGRIASWALTEAIGSGRHSIAPTQTRAIARITVTHRPTHCRGPLAHRRNRSRTRWPSPARSIRSVRGACR